MAPDLSCDADTDATATMFLTKINGGGTPIALDNANRGGVADGATTALTNSFPKWSPFIEKLNEQQQLVWLTFSSTRQYGLRAPPPSTADSNETKLGTLVWMVAINPGVGGGRSQLQRLLPARSRTSRPRTTSPSGRSTSSTSPG